MRTLVGVILGAAAFTLIFSPTRNGILQALFYRDEPGTPADWHPTYRVFHGGVGQDVESFPEVLDVIECDPVPRMASVEADPETDLAAA
jgi:hypothetical protein